MIRSGLISIGIALIIGVSLGYVFQKTEYFIVYKGKKTPINEKTYKSLDGLCSSMEKPFDITTALTGGFASLGLMLIIVGVSSKTKKLAA